jgi:hypothetical protein
MRERRSVVSYRMTAAVVIVGLGVGLGLGLGLPGRASQPSAAQAGNPRLDSGQASRAHGTDRQPVGPGQPADAGRVCGRFCFLLYTRRLGPGTTMNAVVPADNGGGAKIGRKVNMQVAADRMPDGNFTMSYIARVSQFCGTDVHDFFGPGSYLCLHESNFWVFEAQWSPYGADSGLCAGVAVADQIGEDITLRPCGVSDHTLWIADQANGTGGNCRGSASYCPWMNGSDNSFRHPQVLTLDSATTSPVDQLRLNPEQLLPPGNGGRAWNNQEFAFFWQTGT